MTGYPAGYMAGSLLTKTGAGPTPTRTPTTIPGGFAPGAAVHVNAVLLNLRSAPSASSQIIDQMPFGTNGTVTGFPVTAGGFDWYPVTMTGFGAGWVAGEFLDPGVSTAEEPETPVPDEPTDVPEAPTDVPTEPLPPSATAEAPPASTAKLSDAPLPPEGPPD
jgi:hypothetical protein